MAIKNDDNLSEFSKKLLNLMMEQGYDTPKALAVALYDDDLVKVKFRGKDISKKRDNAIGSIEKKIRAHLRADDATCLQGEFVNAYCKYFKCSADYLFGYTQIRTPDVQVRQICELTELSEEVVQRLINSKKEGKEHYNLGWSEMMAGSLYYGVIDNWHQAGEQAILAIQKKMERALLLKEMKEIDGPDLLDYQANLEGVENEYKAANAAYAGMLFNISRNVAAFVEHSLKQKLEVVSEKFVEKYL